MTSRTPLRGRVAAAVATAALVVSACGSSDDAADDTIPAVADDAPAENDEPADSGSATQQIGPIEFTGSPLAPYEGPTDDPAVGLPAPVVSGESFDGSPVVVGAPTDNATLVVFLAHWCPHCNEELPVLVELGASGQLPDGLDVVGVSTAAVADRDNYPPSQWLVDGDWSWPTMADDATQTAISAFGGTSFPFAVVLDSDGSVLARKAGQATADETIAFLNDALASATA